LLDVGEHPQRLHRAIEILREALRDTAQRHPCQADRPLAALVLAGRARSVVAATPTALAKRALSVVLGQLAVARRPLAALRGRSDRSLALDRRR
jgi:hypothetical protein